MECLIPTHQTTKCHIPYKHNADNTHGQGIIKSNILNIVAMLQLLLVRCKRLLNPILSIYEFNASQLYAIHKFQLNIFMHNYHTVLSYSVSIHTSKASLNSQNSCLSIQKKGVLIILAPNIWFSIYMRPNVSAKNVKNSQTSSKNYICGPGLSNRKQFQFNVSPCMEPNY
jgi:hypothetical protein